jgi:hypothetical protein
VQFHSIIVKIHWERFTTKATSSCSPTRFRNGARMSDLIDFLSWVPIITLLIYVPIVCYLDWKLREVEPIYWLGLVAVNIPIMIIFIVMGIYQWWMLVLSLVAIIIYYVLSQMHYIEGADFVYISWILLFFIYNPTSGHWLMALPFSIFLAACSGIAGYWILTYNIFVHHEISFDIERHVPMMFVVSAALVLTVMLA